MPAKDDTRVSEFNEVADWTEHQKSLLALNTGDDPATVFGERLLKTVREIARSRDLITLIADAALLIDNGATVNNQDEDTRMAPLHYAAAYGCRPLIRKLVASQRCDYLLRDKNDRYAFELAMEWARDMGIGNLLMKKQCQQAHERGVPAFEILPARATNVIPLRRP